MHAISIYGLLIVRLNLCRRKKTELVFRETLGREYNCVGNIYIILYLVSLLRTSCGSNPHSRYQWKNSLSVIDWFKHIKSKPGHSFLSFDVAEFYPSITEDITWARGYVNIDDKQINLIKHARKSLLFNDGKTWIKQQNNSLFDVTMGSFDGAEVCELIGLFILNSLAKKYGKDRVGLFETMV